MKGLDIIFFKTPSNKFELFDWNTPCECGCDERLMKRNERLIGYWRSVIGRFGFTIFLKEVA